MKLRKFATANTLYKKIAGVTFNRGEISFTDIESFINESLDEVIFNAYFGTPEVRQAAEKIIKAAATEKGLLSRSIMPVYLEMGRDHLSGFTVPAFNIRVIPYEIMRRIFKKAIETDTSLFIFEIARSEISYTAQPPHLYVTCVLAAALRENYRGPLFIQGDHFQINPLRYRDNPEEELSNIKELIKEAINAGMKNIDIDCSTVVEEGAESVTEKQRLNARLTAELINFVRSLPGGEDVNLGGEIGEIGKENSTPEDFLAFMELLSKHLGTSEPEKVITKISVQTGTRHGGVVLPDGSLAEVNIDFEVLRRISEIARTQFKMAGAVQHGASTLPVEMFDKFPEVGTAEIHLATQFMNIVMDSPALPEDLKKLIRDVTFEVRADVRKNYESDEQFFISNRKFSIKYLAEDLWKLNEKALRCILDEIDVYVSHIFTSLKVVNTRKITDKLFKS